MRINLQKFTLSTLTFSLATTLAVGGFSESANAQRNPGASYDKSNVQPALRFDAIFETDDGDDILDANSSDNIGVFMNAITLDLLQVAKNDNQLKLGAEIFENGAVVVDTISYNPFNNEDFTFNLSAERQGDSIQYQIYEGDINSPKTGIRFAPINVSSFDRSLDLVNNIKDIIESSNNGEYGVEDNNGGFIQNGAGVLGLAINESIRFINDDTNKELNGLDEDEPVLAPDILNIELTPSQNATSIPEPTTTLASVFALAFAGKFLRKSKKSNA